MSSFVYDALRIGSAGTAFVIPCSVASVPLPFSPMSPQSPPIGLPVHIDSWFGHVDVTIVRVRTV